jgi:hypothetical protein
MWIHAVANGILKERLQQKLRYQRLLGSIVDLQLELKPVFQSSLHYVCIKV